MLLGRLKKHEQALAIYTNVLKDYKAAENYCSTHYDRNDPENSKVSHIKQSWSFEVEESDCWTENLNKQLFLFKSTFLWVSVDLLRLPEIFMPLEWWVCFFHWVMVNLKICVLCLQLFCTLHLFSSGKKTWFLKQVSFSCVQQLFRSFSFSFFFFFF